MRVNKIDLGQKCANNLSILVDMQGRIARGQCRFNMHGLKCINSPKIRGNCSVQAGK